MPYYRIVTIYERIPLDKIKGQLTTDELILVGEVNKIIDLICKNFNAYFDPSFRYSWDERLVIAPNIHVFPLLQTECIKGLHRVKNPSFYTNEETVSWEAAVERDRVFNEFQSQYFPVLRELLTDGRLHSSHPLGLKCWIDFILMHHMYHQTDLERHVEASNRSKLEESLYRKETRKLRQEKVFDIIKQAIETIGYDWRTFQPNPLDKTMPSVKDVHESCKTIERDLFRMGLESFRRNEWSQFKSYRDQNSEVIKYPTVINKYRSGV